MTDEDDHLRITPLFVYNELRDHSKECARRWWAVMILAIANLMMLVGGMGAFILNGLIHSH